MSNMILKALGLTLISVLIMFGVQTGLHTERYLQDIGGISAFLVVFGALYGIMAAFIVVEVWVKFNNTKHLIEKEAQEVEKLYGLTLYLRDKNVTKKMKNFITGYTDIIKHESFAQLGEGTKHTEEEKLFRQMSKVIKEIKFNDDHDSIVFGKMLEEYATLSQTRVERIHQCTVRLPVPLRIFFYASTLFTVLSFIFMPFANIYYGLLVTGLLVCSLSMMIDIIEGLDNPVKGYWKLTPKPFEDVLHHIENSYE